MKQVNSIAPNTAEQLKQALQKRQQEQQASAQNIRQQPRPQQEEQEERRRPAHVIPQGDVKTRIWANRNALDDIEWSIDQRRTNEAGMVCKSFRPEHLEDCIRGLYLANKWIKKAERRFTWRRMFR